MIEDEIVREVRAAREAFAASHGYDIQAMVAALRALDVADGREVVRLAPRRPAIVGPEPAVAAQPNDSTSPTSRPPRLTDAGPGR